MQLSTYHDIVYRTINTDCPGYGYLKDFAKALYSHKAELNIENILLFLKLEINNHSTELHYFVNGKKFNTDCFNLVDIAKQKRVVDSARENMMLCKNKNEFGAFHIIAFPVHLKYTREKLFGMKGVVMLKSQTEIGLSSIDQERLYKILCTRKPKTLECPQVRNAMKLLLSTEGKMSDINLKDRHVVLGKALDILGKNGNKKESIHGLRFFSFWTSNNLMKKNLCKEFFKSIYGGPSYYNLTHSVFDGQSHFISDYFSYYKKHENGPFNVVIKLFNSEDLAKSINKNNHFNPPVKVRDDFSVILVPIKFDTHYSFCCFYIKDIFFTPFVSITLFNNLSEAIRHRFNLINELIIKNMLNEMMAISFKNYQSTMFFKEISTLLKKCSEAKDCLIYLKNDVYNRFFLVSEEDENNSSTIHESNDEYNGYEFYLPDNVKSSSAIRKSIHQALQLSTSVCCYPEQEDSFTSACVIVIKDPNNLLCGFFLLLNKYSVSSQFFLNELFFNNSVYIAESCSKYLLLYINVVQSNNRKNYLLKKLRHEIPECTHVIARDISEISTNIGFPEYRIKNFQRKAKEILINSRRIDNIASFFSAIDFDDGRFLDYPLPFRMRDFINERIELFREEAAFRGVYVKFNVEKDTPILYVSDYYLHSITNIITNAIRYAAPGTCIWICSNSNMISVSDIGIGISDSEKKMIFKEGYRSVAAKNVSQQGMGYGLYLVKRILDAYGHDIDVSCVQVSNRNHYAELMVSRIISNFPQKRREKYVLTDTLPQEENEVWRRVNTIKKSELQIPQELKSFINDDKESTSQWFEYHRKFGPSFFIMEDEYFNQPVYKVTFTIKFPK